MSYTGDQFITDGSWQDYQPIENEPMGTDYTPLNIEPSLNAQGMIGGLQVAPPKQAAPKYTYLPLSYKTPATSYMDSWNVEHMSGKLDELSCFNILMLILIVVLVYLLDCSYRVNKKLVKILERGALN